MSASLADVVTAVAERLRTVPGLRTVYDWPTLQVTPPAAIVTVDPEGTFHYTVGPIGAGALSRMPLSIVLVASQASERTGYGVLLELLGTGANRVPAVLEADNTLGGLVSGTRVLAYRMSYGLDFGGVTYVGAEIDMEVTG